MSFQSFFPWIRLTVYSFPLRLQHLGNPNVAEIAGRIEDMRRMNVRDNPLSMAQCGLVLVANSVLHSKLLLQMVGRVQLQCILQTWDFCLHPYFGCTLCPVNNQFRLSSGIFCADMHQVCAVLSFHSIVLNWNIFKAKDEERSSVYGYFSKNNSKSKNYFCQTTTSFGPIAVIFVETRWIWRHQITLSMPEYLILEDYVI